jgi:diaminopropionate ammonia-lyase
MTLTTGLPPAYSRRVASAWRCADAPTEVWDFHRGLPGYAPTPLLEVPSLAEQLGVGRVLVKDESNRLGLPAFKALGASWGIRQALVGRLLGPGADGPSTVDGLRALAAGQGLVLVTATEGNHGRAVAHFARLIGVDVRVFVPEHVGEPSVAAIRAEGADVVQVTGDYDNAIAMAAGSDGILVQDTAWPGYEAIPAAIVDGYSTLFREIDTELAHTPTMLAVPMGVGSLAHAAVRHYRSRHAGKPVSLLGVEPTTAACLLASLDAGELVTVGTSLTVMAGLNCGTPSSTAWPILRDGLTAAVAVSDDQTSLAVRDLAAVGVEAGPSGAASLSGARSALANRVVRRDLNVRADSCVVLVCTEGRVR